jgi:bifunctional ADP-heptose synthase (sugar kinase/adenylyltransferase)
MDTRTKILTPAQALQTAARLRREGRTLRLAAGSFDVLQAFHARFLSGLCSNGDALLVAVYDDASLGHPLLGEQARSQLVAALKAVDHVLIWPSGQMDELRQQLGVERVEQVPRGARNIIEEVLERHK